MRKPARQPVTSNKSRDKDNWGAVSLMEKVTCLGISSKGRPLPVGAAVAVAAAAIAPRVRLTATGAAAVLVVPMVLVVEGEAAAAEEAGVEDEVVEETEAEEEICDGNCAGGHKVKSCEAGKGDLRGRRCC